MASPCNNLNVVPIKVSQLVRYKNLDLNDIILTIESGSKLNSRRSTIADLKNSLSSLTGSYTGSFSGSFKGKSSGSFSGSYWGSVVSKKTIASGSFSGSYWGSVVSKNVKASGSFSGSHYGKLISKNAVASGSFSGSHYGKFVGKNASISGVFSGSFSGSYFGKIISKNTKATGSFSGTNNKLSGSFSGSSFGKFTGKNSIISGSFRGIDNITNFKGTGKKVSFNGTASYAVSSSYTLTASYLAGSGGASGLIRSANSVQYSTQNTGTGTSWFDTALSITITPDAAGSKFLINASIVLANGNAPGNAIAGLWKLQGGVYTPLIEQFTSVDGSTFDAQPSSTTYIDTAGSTTSRTYLVRVKGDAVGSYWYTNRAHYGTTSGYSATSSMTILEFIV